MTVRVSPVSFENHRGLLLRGYVHVPKQYDTAVVLCHGFPSNMEGGSKRFSADLSKRGYLCLRFNFSGTDTSQGMFQDKLMSEEVKDIRSAITFVAKQYPGKRIVLFGHSTGAIDAALYAYTDKRLAGVILSGAVCQLDQAVRFDFTDRQVRDFWMKGFTYKCATKPRKKKHQWLWKAQRGKIKKAFYDEFFTLDIPRAIKKYRKPLLILHGEQDEAVTLNHPKALFALANKPKRIAIITGADHSFQKPVHQAKATREIVRFLKHLRE